MAGVNTTNPVRRVADLDEIADTAPKVSAQERKARLSRMGQMKDTFKSMDRVSIRLQEDTRVQINGYVFNIKGKTRVSVPALVAEVLEQSGRA